VVTAKGMAYENSVGMRAVQLPIGFKDKLMGR